MFKFIGFIAGYYFFGFFGALVGLFVGSLIDRLRAYGAGAMNPLQNALRQTVFIETMFLSMGKLAKADGRVSEDEIAHVEALMQKLGMTAEHRIQAIALFKRGADPAFEIESTCAFWVVFTERRHAVCLEPQTAPPDALNHEPFVVEPGRPLVAECIMKWGPSAGG